MPWYPKSCSIKIPLVCQAGTFSTKWIAEFLDSASLAIVLCTKEKQKMRKWSKQPARLTACECQGNHHTASYPSSRAAELGAASLPASFRKLAEQVFFLAQLSIMWMKTSSKLMPSHFCHDTVLHISLYYGGCQGSLGAAVALGVGVSSTHRDRGAHGGCHSHVPICKVSGATLIASPWISKRRLVLLALVFCSTRKN